jgi:hypothetical protein
MCAARWEYDEPEVDTDTRIDIECHRSGNRQISCTRQQRFPVSGSTEPCVCESYQ